MLQASQALEEDDSCLRGPHCAGTALISNTHSIIVQFELMHAQNHLKGKTWTAG